jgi:predicted nucleotidyltransferase
MDQLRAKITAFFNTDARVADVVAVYLFGSAARGTDGAGSDIDVGLLYRRAPGATLTEQPFDVAADLSEALGREVDLVVMDSAPVDLVKRILRDGDLLVERDRGARVAFEVRARNEYFDLLPMLRLYRRQAASS